MTKAQRNLYWREWGKVHKMYPHIDRHDMHAAALGTDKSSSAFSNRDLDLVLGQFRAITSPADLDMQLRQATMDRTRLLYAIEKLLQDLAKLGIDSHAYLLRILKERFHVRHIEDLSHEKDGKHSELDMLRMTIAARLHHKQKEAA